MEIVTEGLPTFLHTILAEKGINAIEKMSKIVLAMKSVNWTKPEVPDEVNRLYPDATCYWNIGIIEGSFKRWR